MKRADDTSAMHDAMHAQAREDERVARAKIAAMLEGFAKARPEVPELRVCLHDRREGVVSVTFVGVARIEHRVSLEAIESTLELLEEQIHPLASSLREGRWYVARGGELVEVAS